MNLNRAHYATQEHYTNGLLAWGYLEKAIEHDLAKRHTQASMSLSLACHKELQSLGFVSTLVEMRANVRQSWC